MSIRFVSAEFRLVRRVVCNPLKLLVRLVLRFVNKQFQKIRRVVCKWLKMAETKIRPVSSPVPPIPPTRARAKESRRTRNEAGLVLRAEARAKLRVVV